MAINLSGLCVLNTRPATKALELTKHIELAGGKSITFPVIEITEPADPTALIQAIKNLDQFTYAIFTSAHAVTPTLTAIKKQWLTIPPHLFFMAVGESTAKALKAWQITQVIYPENNFSSEALLELAELQHIADKKIVIFCGEHARQLLPETLRARHAHVTEAHAYQRKFPHVNSAAIITELCQKNIDIILVSSKESLVNLIRLLGEDGLNYLQATPLLVTSPSIAKAAREQEMQQTIITVNSARTIDIMLGLAEMQKLKIKGNLS